jgi:hypothetical protein
MHFYKKCGNGCEHGGALLAVPGRGVLLYAPTKTLRHYRIKKLKNIREKGKVLVTPVFVKIPVPQPLPQNEGRGAVVRV